MSQTGSVKKVFEDKGFGFIIPHAGGDDIFFHMSQVVGASSMTEGVTVSFDRQYNELRGNFRAVNCKVMGADCSDGTGASSFKRRRQLQLYQATDSQPCFAFAFISKARDEHGDVRVERSLEENSLHHILQRIEK
eukprot:TRINITY_DN24240_c0_g1_i2.p1 TRINITY_DN24240_c0_g1~~TRINITY_DN24240_c0_g1_i2.p1  ORF type:complete len:153 (-),score=26.32 TRINITY_DN24240_c0_g1_i2:79-483(-)